MARKKTITRTRSREGEECSHQWLRFVSDSLDRQMADEEVMKMAAWQDLTMSYVITAETCHPSKIAALVALYTALVADLVNSVFVGGS